MLLRSRIQKPTGLLTNMACFTSWRSGVRDNRLTQFTHHWWESRGDNNNSWVWKTSLAATYPTELCQAMASCYRQVATTPPGATQPIQWIGNSRIDPLLPPACKVRRAQEAYAAIGGLRDPAVSLKKLPDLGTYGNILNLALAKVLDRDRTAEDALVSVRQGKCEGFLRKPSSWLGAICAS